jgi:hypothetical protein
MQHPLKDAQSLLCPSACLPALPLMQGDGKAALLRVTHDSQPLKDAQ